MKDSKNLSNAELVRSHPFLKDFYADRLVRVANRAFSIVNSTES